MKYGAIWFLHLDAPIQFSRIAVLLTFIAGCFSTIGSILFILSWILFAIFLVITICTCFMHIPSSQKVDKFVSQYEDDFCNKQKTEFRNYGKVKITTLRCFSNDSKVNMSRWVGSKKIYSTLIMLAWVETKNALWLVCDEKPLTRDLGNTTKRYEVKDFKDVKVEKETPNADGEVNWSLKIDDVCLKLCCKDDYHLRDFLNLVRGNAKKGETI